MAAAAPPGARPIYLDWNATTPPLPAVVEAMAAAAAEAWGNPSSVHAVGRAARDRVETAREAVAAWVGVNARDVVLTSGGTEANNLALWNASALLTSRIEHPSVTRVAEQLVALGRPVRWLAVNERGELEPESIAAALSELARAAPGAVPTVAVAAANHETGVIQPMGAILQVVRAQGARLHVDAVQALGKIEQPLLAEADTVALAAHKFRGPKGIGALIHRPDRAPRPLLLGGAQERGRRPGTLDASSAAGLAAAVAWARGGPERYARLAVMRDRLEALLVELGGEVNGQGAPRLPHVLNASFGTRAGDELVAALDLQGFAVSSGSACSAGTPEPSPVIAAMLGISRARGAVRVSLGELTTPAEVEAFGAALAAVIRQ